MSSKIHGLKFDKDYDRIRGLNEESSSGDEVTGYGSKAARYEPPDSVTSDAENGSVDSNSNLGRDSPSHSSKRMRLQAIGNSDEVGYEAEDSTVQLENLSHEVGNSTHEADLGDERESSGSSTHLSMFADEDTDNDVCMVCADSHRWKEMVECDFCREWVHLGCLGMPSVIPEGQFFCREACKTGYNRLMTNIKEDAVESVSSEESLEVLDRPEQPLRWRSPMQETAENIAKLRSKNIMSVVSISKWADEGCGLTKKCYANVLQAQIEMSSNAGCPLTEKQLEVFRRAAPPNDTVRSARACGSSAVRRTVLVHQFKKLKVCAYFVLYHRCPYDVAMDLYESTQINAAGPVYDWDSPQCSNGRVPKVRDAVEKFARENNFDPTDRKNLTLVTGLYSDESNNASGNVHFNPMWAYPVLMDPDARQMLGLKAHSVVAMLPEMTSLQFASITDSGESVEDSAVEQLLSQDNKRTALKELQASAIEVILESWKRYERLGKRYGDRNVRLLLWSYIADMKERRGLLGLRGDAWHCSHCYDFPGKNNDEKEGKRSAVRDEQFRTEYRDKGRSTRKETLGDIQDFNKDHTKHGLRFEDHCPFTSSESSTIFLPNGPYEAFMFEPLHMKDGVVKYYMKYLQGFLGENFIEVSREFGNLYLMTGKFQMHIFEKGIESFHFVTLALLYGEMEKPLSRQDREELFRGSCDLLLILVLLADPCPGLILGDLKAAIARFEKHIRWLLKQAGRNETTKMHELFAHVVDQIERGGVPNGFSAKILETFHEMIKDLFKASSKRRGGEAFREIIDSLFYRNSVEEFRCETIPCLSSSPWQETAVFNVSALHIKQELKPSPGELLRLNMRTVGQRLFRMETSNITLASFTPAASLFKYGNTCTMRIRCARRDCNITPDRKAVVPGTSKGMFRSGGAFNVLAFKKAQTEEHIQEEDDEDRAIPCCRFHDEDFQLFCSASRRKETSYAIPLIFFDEFCYVWELKEYYDPDVPEHEAVQLFQVTDSVKCVWYTSVRGVSMAVAHPMEAQKLRGECFVFLGLNVFGFDT